jgi:hypothetical protein
MGALSLELRCQKQRVLQGDGMRLFTGSSRGIDGVSPIRVIHVGREARALQKQQLAIFLLLLQGERWAAGVGQLDKLPVSRGDNEAVHVAAQQQGA